MSLALTIELDDAELLARLDSAIEALENPRDLLQGIGDTLEANAALRFDTKTDPQGQPWAPLSPTTVAIYESDWFKKRNPAFAKGIPGTLLQRTNQMRASLAHNVGDSFLEIGFSRATPGEKWQVSMLHEFGTRTMPRRGILLADPKTGRLGDEDQADVLTAIDQALGLFGR